MMDCRTAREWLWARRREYSRSNEWDRALDHFEGCEGCRDYMSLDPVLLDSFARLGSLEAPDEVRGRVKGVLRALEDVDVSVIGLASRRRFQTAATVTLLAAAGLAAVTFLGGGGAVVPESGGAFVEDYMRRAVAGEHISTSDPTEITAFFERELGIGLQPLAGLDLEGAEVCLLDGERGALILYKQDGEVLSHYLIPGTDPELVEDPQPQPAIAVVGEGSDNASVNLVTWSSTGFRQALVGRASTDRLVRLARRSESE